MPETKEYWSDVPAKYEFKCRRCGSDKIKFHLWESSDGAHEDYKYWCTACDRQWWVDGIDY